MNAAVNSVKSPRMTVSYVLVEHKGLVLGKNAYGVDTRVNAVGQREVDNSVLAAVG